MRQAVTILSLFIPFSFKITRHYPVLHRSVIYPLIFFVLSVLNGLDAAQSGPLLSMFCFFAVFVDSKIPLFSLISDNILSFFRLFLRLRSLHLTYPPPTLNHRPITQPQVSESIKSERRCCRSFTEVNIKPRGAPGRKREREIERGGEREPLRP